MKEVSKDYAMHLFNEYEKQGLECIPCNEFMVRLYGKDVEITVISWGKIVIDVLNKEKICSNHSAFRELYWKLQEA